MHICTSANYRSAANNGDEAKVERGTNSGDVSGLILRIKLKRTMVFPSIIHARGDELQPKMGMASVLFLHLPFLKLSICKLQKGRKFCFYWLVC